AYDPQFIVQDEPVVALARPACCWQYGDSTPRVGGWVVSVLRAWRCPPAYHVDFAIEQHTCHVALARRHRRPGGVAVRTRIIDESADSRSSTLGVWHGDRSHGRPTGAVEALVYGGVIGGSVEPGDGIQVRTDRHRGRVAPCIGHGRFSTPCRCAAGRSCGRWRWRGAWSERVALPASSRAAHAVAEVLRKGGVVLLHSCCG